MARKAKPTIFDGYEWLSGFAATEDTRPVLAQVMVTEHDGARLAVACDGFRLAAIPVADSVPLGGVAAHKRERPDGADGTYPQWDQVAYYDPQLWLEVATVDLLRAAKTANVIGREADSIRVIWDSDDNTARFFAHSSEFGEVSIAINATLVDGEALTIQFAISPRFLLHALSGWDDAVTRIGLMHANNRIKLEPKRDGDKPLVVIMAKVQEPQYWIEDRNNLYRLLSERPRWETWQHIESQTRYVDTLTNRISYPDSVGPLLWDTGIPKLGGMAAVHAIVTAIRVPEEAAKAFVALRAELVKSGWTDERRRAVGCWAFKGEVATRKPKRWETEKIYLSDKDWKLKPTESNREYCQAIRLAAREAGCQRSPEQRIMAERVVASMTPRMKRVHGWGVPQYVPEVG